MTDKGFYKNYCQPTYSDSKNYKEDWEIMSEKICYCNDVSEEEIRKAIRNKKLTTVDEVCDFTNAGTGCQSCLCEIEDILREELTSPTKDSIEEKEGPRKISEKKKRIELDSVVIRFAGDSGDGMQLTGTQFTNTSAIMGNDISTFPDYPSEIRAPTGSLPGVSAFQIHFSNHHIRTPGDAPHVLVAMNPAALKIHLPDLREDGILIIDLDAFTPKNLEKAGYTENPLHLLKHQEVLSLPITSLTLNAVKSVSLATKQARRCKNFFALGILYFLYDRIPKYTLEWLEKTFGANSPLMTANKLALKAGYYYGDTAEIFISHYKIKKAEISRGKYCRITGNEATAIGFVTASKLANRTLFYGSYPITPASDILHWLSRYKNFGVKTFQAEDEIAAVCSAIGASFAGNLALTGSSGPGVALKSEAIGLATMMELPLVIIDVQRAGPSTGMPTKTEQGDLLQAMFGRNGESRLPILAPSTPSDCFYMAIEAFRIATKYMTPVFFMSDAYLASGTEPFLIPDMNDLPKINIHFETNPEDFYPYKRDPLTSARPWGIPGTKGLEHRIGGLEKENITGNVSYAPKNHERMVKLRARKLNGIAKDIPKLEVFGDVERKDLLVLGWGSTYGAIATAVENLQKEGFPVCFAHLRYLNPFPANLGEILRQFRRVLIPENNMGQLSLLIRSRFLVDALSYSKVQGKPFQVAELREKILEILNF